MIDEYFLSKNLKYLYQTNLFMAIYKCIASFYVIYKNFHNMTRNINEWMVKVPNSRNEQQMKAISMA